MTTRVNVWSGPRNVSTALMYAFRQRPDTTVVDEPLYGHYLHATGVDHPGGDRVLQEMELDGRLVVDRLLGPWPTEVVMFKQMAHHLVGLDTAWIGECRNVILVREPADVLASYTEQVDEPTLDMIGYPTLVAILDVARQSGQDVPVVDARRLLGDPVRMLARVCEIVGIPWDTAMLSWPPGPKREDGSWAEHWYAGVHRSTGFHAPSAPKGRDAVDPQHHEILDQADVLYDRLLEDALPA